MKLQPKAALKMLAVLFPAMMAAHFILQYFDWTHRTLGESLISNLIGAAIVALGATANRSQKA